MGRSKAYVSAICEELGDGVVKNKKVVAIQRASNGDGKLHITVTCHDGDRYAFDTIVFACHPDQALKILADNATPLERNNLRCFTYSNNDTYVHSDLTLMPKCRYAWASWNYIGRSKGQSNERPVFVSYWLNKLQSLKHSNEIIVSLNPFNAPSPEKTYARILYEHPQYTSESVAAQERVKLMNGQNNTYFCGAWLGYGFHEDGCRAGIEVATAITGKAVPWATEVKHEQQVMKANMNKMTSWYGAFVGMFTRPLIWILEEVCRSQILTFMSKGIRRGRITFITSSGRRFTFGSITKPEDEEVTVLVYKSWFWVRVALEADLGLARSYIAGEWAVQHSGPHFDGLTKLLRILLDNMPTGKTHTSGGIDVAKLTSAWVGSALNWVWYRLTMDNSISNSRSNIHAVRFHLITFSIVTISPVALRPFE